MANINIQCQNVCHRGSATIMPWLAVTPRTAKLEEVTTAEGFYEWTFYLIFSMLNVYVQTQVKCANGRTDMVVFMPDTIYVMELKINGTAQDALQQIEDKGYARRYATDGRRIVKAGMAFDTEKRSLTEYVIE